MFRLIFTATAVLTGSSVVYFYIFHKKLSARIQHRSHCGKLAASAKPCEIESIPDAVFTDKYFTLYDWSSKSVPRYLMPGCTTTEELFTKLVRRNMTVFTHFPQALMIRVGCTTAEEIHSFKTSHISSLDFDKGDLVCGVYRVIARSKNKVEFEMTMKNMEFVNGRLALSFKEKGGDVIFSSETVMWRRADESRTMPLEKCVVRFMHETAAWWLIDSGTKYLMDLEV
ncbi:hypothetical protein N7448_003603 [Penicillium atrosanguineum]|uniref:Uncharacterized protein n=1 Tax=Penicillium atrosanguineum TaxID=1132637 RepID=A0A9W9PXV3_9EURO|nr:LPS-induced tumor necrosis factor alpha factor [Penicillium atrosanguineum]KAJ5122469.1 hypothetical protein N7526_009406 [Penicillium atrosanguineum]KAJ5140195.1 hypothetical protein N7448_003603 [Penicillium atrosanguineum]KAJ5310112.1 LPS-induced tumor necrosis factor alpha factor [Penicillium atrosanguineum]KAJ5315628.1 hypothetical protein N7476_005935 [Penicillium atrosanguineum]